MKIWDIKIDCQQNKNKIKQLYQKFINGDIRTKEGKTTEEKIEYILKEMENLQTKQAEYQEILAEIMFENTVDGEVIE